MTPERPRFSHDRWHAQRSDSYDFHPQSFIQKRGSFRRSEALGNIHCGRVNANVPLPPDGRPVCACTSQAPEAREGTPPEQLALASLACVFLTISLGADSSSYERPRW